MSEDHGNCDCGASSIERRRFVQGCGAALAFAAAGTSLTTVKAQETEEESAIERLLADAPKNWGRWGENDELGALNLLGSEEAFEGMRAAMQGGKKSIERFTLQLSMTGEVINPDPNHPQVFFSKPDEGITWPSTDTGDPVFPPRTPARRSNTTGKGGLEVAGGGAYVDDKFVNDFFLQGTTHLDAIGHAWYGSEIYNGYPAETTRTLKEFETTMEGTEQADSLTGDDDSLKPVSETRGLAKADTSNSASAGVAGRGVLLDVGRQFGDEKGRLPLEAEVTFDDLVKTADAQDVDIRERDILLVRTGAIARTRDPEAKWGPALEPGLVYSEELVQWIHEMDIPYIGADNLAVEKVGQVIDGETITIPLHSALLRNLGVYLNEVLWLEDLSVACAEDGIYDFLFTGAPLKVERASGAPINPVVLKATDECEDENDENDE